MRLFGGLTRLAVIVSLLPTLASATIPSEVVTFQSGDVTLHGVLYKPEGTGPFPAVLYNHDSAPGMLSNQAFEAIAPVYLGHGYVFFAPYRRGQGLSASAGPFIGAEITAARREGWKRSLLIFVAAFIVLVVFLLFTTHRTWVWVRAFGIAILAVVTVGAVYLSGIRAAAAQMVKLLETDHLNDQLAAYDWLRKQDFIQPDRIAVAGNSFGGVEALLGAERVKYCAAIDAAGGSETWADASDLQARMIAAVRNSQAPIFFFQAENDYDLTPSRILFAAVNDAGKIAELRIYPPFRKSAAEGHSFAWLGASKWAEDVLAFLDDYCAG